MFSRAMVLRLWAGMLVLALAGCGDEGLYSTSPSSTSPSDTASSSAALSLGPVVGTTVNAITGAPVSSASLVVDSGASLVSGPDGRFRVELEAFTTAGTAQVVVEAPGFFRRETHMRPASSAADGPPVVVELLPEGGEFDFDLEFFDHVFRDVGAAGTHPWSTEPVFEIWQRVFRCTAFQNESPCDELTALATRVPEEFNRLARDVIESDARRYTDGHVLGSNVTFHLHPTGTVVPRDAFIDRGKIVVALVVRGDNFSWAFWRFARDDAMVGGHIHVNRTHMDLRGVYSHELAHTLGFAHPLGLERVPRDSIMRQGHGDEPTRLDVLHGRVLYHRPPGSRTPDIDPPNFLLNGSRDAALSGAGGGTTLSAR